MKKILSGSIVKNPTDLLKGSSTDHIEDRSAYLRSDDVITWSGTDLSFTSDIVLEILNTSNGTTSLHNILTADSPIALNDGESLWISIDRTLSTENVTAKLSDTDPIPAHSAADKDVFVLFKRIDVAGTAYLHLPFSKQVLNQGQTVRLGASGSSSGSGSGGVNFVGLDANWVFNSPDDVNAENNIGHWAAYADAAGTEPVDMTGGSPTVTITKTTTAGEVLDGRASFKVTKDAADRQGEGVSLLVYVPFGYRGRVGNVIMPFNVITGTIISGDLKVFLYDVTNAQVITPVNNDLVTSFNEVRASFDIPETCEQLRVGFHFASTSASALEFSFDDVFVGIQDTSSGPAMTEWQAFDLSIDAATSNPTKGTVARDEARWRRVGDSMEIEYNYRQTVAGTAGSGAYIFRLPTGYEIDTTKLSLDGSVGTQSYVGSGLVGDADGPGPSIAMAYLAAFDSTGLRMFVHDETSASNDIDAVTDAFFGLSTATVRYSFAVRVPIAGWSTNVATASGNLFRLSDILVSGTRVTGSAPTKLGEYRSYLRANGTTTFSETNGAPTISPSIADGIAIYFNSAGDSNNEPSKYDFFVGKNKAIRLQYYLTTGRTGFVDITPSTRSSFNYGFTHIYDPTTGILTVLKYTGDNTTALKTGADEENDDLTTSPIYFDVHIANNDFQIQLIRNPMYASSGSLNDSTTSATPTLITGASVDVTKDSNEIFEIFLESDGGIGSIHLNSVTTAYPKGILRLRRNSVVIAEEKFGVANSGTTAQADWPSSSFKFTDKTPVVGINTYELYFYVTTPSDLMTINNCILTVKTIKD